MGGFADFAWIETVGWLASALTVATYAVGTMLPLRVLAILSSLCFGIYAFALQLWPLLAMELILLPINLFRLWQLLSLRGQVSRATGREKPDFSVVKTYGKRRRLDAGTVVFTQGDAADALYLLAEGRIRIEEHGADISAGEIFGEIAFFTQAEARTATARCLERSVVYAIDAKTFMRLQFEDPSFGLSIMRTVTQRMAANMERLSKPVFVHAERSTA